MLKQLQEWGKGDEREQPEGEFKYNIFDIL
jgi:hypothetical protein